MTALGPEDHEQLESHGIGLGEAERQLALLRNPPAPLRLLRPATVGDGIEAPTEAQAKELHALHAVAAREGRFTKFVPASGAASRMFADLARFRGRDLARADVVRLAGEGDEAAAALLAFLDGIPQLPFAEALVRQAGGPGESIRALLDALLDEGGLDYGSLPKGLIPFHRYGHEARTAFEEHLVEAAAYVRDGRGVCRLHFTVSPEHVARFEAALREVREGYESAFGVRLEVGFSTQRPATDMLAQDATGAPFRLADGTLLLRPGGHGALVENLNALGEEGADLVFVKNIDNVVPDRLRGPTVLWKKAIAGRLLALERRAQELARLLASGETAEAVVREAEAFCREALQAPPPPEGLSGAARRVHLLDRLRRPLRVCGVVPNTGEPGGGPFWVASEDGAVSLQIVEGAQVDAQDPAQATVYASSTHFSPTDLVCALRDPDGHPYDLRRYVDPAAVLLARKTHEGRALLALERPGLWNGGMAHWNTVFVAIPIETFTPVKTVLDLLRPEHQPA
jgi:hypothetical protein